MIDIRITADTPAELHQTMLALLAGTAITASAAPAVEPPKAGRGRGKAKEPGPTPDPNVAAGAAGTSVSGAEVSPPATAGDVTRETLTPKILALGQKAGPTAVTELFGEFGAKKLGEVEADKYVALNVRLDELLTPDA